MAEQGKRKGGGGDSDDRAVKRSKNGSGGKWKTPFQKNKEAARLELGTSLEVGDRGIWVTYARNMKTKAIREFSDVCKHYGKELYGLKNEEEETEESSTGDNGDSGGIVDSINSELESLKKPSSVKTERYFIPSSANLECVFFMKTKSPVEPDRLVLKICEEARECHDPMGRKCKYINRLTPVLDMDKATENGIEKVARRILHPHFTLRTPDGEGDQKTAAEQEGTEPPLKDEVKYSSYAIRHNVRNHETFKSSEVIQKVASVIDTRHKVDLSNPDKVILVEVYQLVCGLSVVDGGQWEQLKRYNVNEMYKLASASRASNSRVAVEDAGGAEKSEGK